MIPPHTRIGNHAEPPDSNPGLLAKLRRPEVRDAICFYAANTAGDFASSDDAPSSSPAAEAGAGAGGDADAAGLAKERSTNAVTWGVFPGKEIVTPTIIEEVSFRAWSEEAFSIWGEWAKVYGRGSDSEKLLHHVRADLWLVNIIHHDYIDKDALWNLLLK